MQLIGVAMQTKCRSRQKLEEGLQQEIVGNTEGDRKTEMKEKVWLKLQAARERIIKEMKWDEILLMNWRMGQDTKGAEYYVQYSLLNTS